ncbi:zeta toxin family protein [Chitinophaga agri]|uniref:Zeta toxin domain-containing protein n=1 Tax=Chitinophaga agri TaxID=2703787 RepID=A0A6B9ZKV3_9BACT|nr:zeta toxin family protein [Chitinophaga agri]QHS61253.1 hypothetical protein GWR21_17105 [Chitinophaga agri]
MAKRSNRPLNNMELVEHFLENVLSMDLDSDKGYSIVPKIVSTELNIENFDESLISVNSKSYRSSKYRKDQARIKLWRQIVTELLSMKRLKSDEGIRLKKGGAFPNSGVRIEREAYIIIGLPASGKSSISNRIADEFGAIILDSDYAKRKLPEFNALPFGATLVHEESDRIVFGDPNNKEDFRSLFDHCIELNANIVIPKIGSNVKGINILIDTLLKVEYKVNLTLLELDRVKATKRALERFITTDRYVPLSLIFDTYGNHPTITYFKIVEQRKEDLKSYGIISNDVAKNKSPVKIFSSNDYNPAILYSNG